MDLNRKRKEIKATHFQTGGLVIVSILGIIGILLLIFTGLFEAKNITDFKDVIYQHGLVIIFSLFFMVISLYCWIAYFFNIVINPKKEILYLYKNQNNERYFIDKKGKKYIYNTKALKDNSYYYVYKTRDYIYEVLDETTENWSVKEKSSYWLNFYSPVGNFEDILLLPIVYVILLPGLLSLIMAKGYDKIYGLIYCVVPLYVIGYDFIYKTKLKKSKDKTEIDIKPFFMSYEILINIISSIIVIIMFFYIINIFVKLSDATSRLIISPFLCCILCTIGLVTSNIFKKRKLAKIFLKGYIVIFLIYWFGFLIFWTIGITKQSGSYLPAIFSIPFWTAGLLITYKNFIKKK